MNKSPLTNEQERLASREGAVFAEACPGAGKTRSMVARVARIAEGLQPRTGVAVLSFTNSAVDAFLESCSTAGLHAVLKFPSFVGTFDSFIRQFLILPGGIDGTSARPMVLDSWNSLGIEVRLGGLRAFPGPGVPLDSFNPLDNQIDPSAIGHSGLRDHVRLYQSEYVQAATRLRRNLHGKGYISAADARTETLSKLRVDRWAGSMGRILSARFREVIVDEAQDCNPNDLRILTWLRSHGLRITTVCDPDQAIYGFRFGNPANLVEFRAEYASENCLHLTGNFRSSANICGLAATLRSLPTPDEAVGSDAGANHPIHVVVYQGRTVPPAVGQCFTKLLEQAGLNSGESIVLAHKRNSALRACGLTSAPDISGTSRVDTIAKAVNDFWSSTATGRSRESALCTAEKAILDLQGMIEANEHPSRAAERHGIDARWLRRMALQFVTRLPKSCPDTPEGHESWLETLYRQVGLLKLTYPAGMSEKKYFRRPKSSNWCKRLQQGHAPDIRCSTIHEAKGREYEAVCVIIPPDGGLDFTTQLFQAWETRADSEAKRVVYVGVTRARKLVALAVPRPFMERLSAILDPAGLTYDVHDIAPTVTVTDRSDAGGPRRTRRAKA